MRVKRGVAGLAFVLGSLGACSGTTPYRDAGERNLKIRTETSSGSAFSKVRASVDIYRVDTQCRVEYEGTVALDAPVVSAGIPLDRPSLLVFTFSSSSFLGGTRGTISREALLRPRPGYRYDFDVRYKDDIYDVAPSETAPRESRARPSELSPLAACRRQ